MSDSYQLSLAFDTDDFEFVRGFEAGRVWTGMCLVTEGFEVRVHGANAEMFMRMGEATKREVKGTMLSKDWMELDIGPMPTDEGSA